MFVLILFSDQNFLCSSFKGDDKFDSIWKHSSVLHVNLLRAVYKGKWFRADKGAAMPSSCVLKETCGVQAPGWLNGHIPSRETGIVQRQVCFNFRKDCCFYSVPVQIKKCSDFFVYKLKEVHPMIPGQYCFSTNTVGRFTKQCYMANQGLVDCRLSNNSPNTMPKCEYSDFTLSVEKLIVLYFLCFAIALKQLAPIFHLIIEVKPTMTHSCTFSRASRLLQVITSSFDWLTVFSMSFVIGWANTSVGFTHSFTKKTLNNNLIYNGNRTEWSSIRLVNIPVIIQNRTTAKRGPIC